MKTPPPPKPIHTLEEAHARIAELEKALDDTISLLVKRDALLEAYERRLRQLDRPS